MLYTHMAYSLLSLALAASSVMIAIGQQCPLNQPNGFDTPPNAISLEGKLIFHDGIRKWFELKLDQPQCGQTSVELVPGTRQLEALRGCRVRSKGALGFSPTGYYTLDVYQGVETIEFTGACPHQPPLPDYSKAKPDPTVRAYRVEMRLDYEPGDHPIQFSVATGSKVLQPWQAYASYYLTGGLVLYGHCGEGFVVDKVFGTRQASPSHFEEPRTPDDMAEFDPESAASSGVKKLRLGYTCVRTP